MTVLPPRSLAQGEVHLWFAFPDAPQLRDPQLLQAYDALLSEPEREQQQRYLLARHRHQALVSRALVRTTLSRYASHVPPAAWRFVLGEHGRPEIAEPALPLRFNLSHTDGLIVVGVTWHRAIRVDVEHRERRVEGDCIAERFFARAEVAQLNGGRAGFFELWTLKEAYIKARGAGLSLSLHRFAFDLGPHTVDVRFDPELNDDPATWRFAQLSPTPQHVAAVAIQSDQPLQARTAQVVPLRSEAALACGFIRGSSRGSSRGHT